MAAVHVIIFGLASMSLLCHLFLCIVIPKAGWNANKYLQYIYRKRKAKRTRPKKRQLHELPYTDLVKSGTIRLLSGLGETKA